MEVAEFAARQTGKVADICIAEELVQFEKELVQVPS